MFAPIFPRPTKPSFMDETPQMEKVDSRQPTVGD